LNKLCLLAHSAALSAGRNWGSVPEEMGDFFDMNQVAASTVSFYEQLRAV
jgi:hypothetical protein